MKKLYFFLIINILFFSKSLSQEYRPYKNSLKVNMIVDSSCGKCQFGDKTIKECMLAVKINSEYYYINDAGSEIFDSKTKNNELCNVIKKAHITGELADDLFYLYTFKLRGNKRNQ